MMKSQLKASHSFQPRRKVTHWVNAGPTLTPNLSKRNAVLFQISTTSSFTDAVKWCTSSGGTRVSVRIARSKAVTWTTQRETVKSSSSVESWPGSKSTSSSMVTMSRWYAKFHRLWFLIEIDWGLEHCGVECGWNRVIVDVQLNSHGQQHCGVKWSVVGIALYAMYNLILVAFQSSWWEIYEVTCRWNTY